MPAGCKQCGGPLPLMKGRHRPRLFCTTCKPPRTKTPFNGPVVTPDEMVAEVRDLHPSRDLVAATEGKLRAAGRLDDPEGLVVLELARAIRDGAHSGSSLAALSREFTRALAAACSVDEAPAADDVEWGVG